MRFGKKLLDDATPEWRAKYIDYERLKGEIYDVRDAAPEIGSGGNREDFFASYDEDFIEECAEELQKVEAFYFERINRAAGTQHDLSLQLSGLIRRRRLDSVGGSSHPSEPRKPSVGVRLEGTPDIMRNAHVVYERLAADRGLHDKFRKAYAELYLKLLLIQNYQELNFSGFYKIMKKHDKVFETTSGVEWYKQNVCPSKWVQDGRINNFIDHIEDIYVNVIEGGDRTKAKNRLRVPPLKEKTSIFVTFRLGLYIGAIIILLVAMGISMGSPMHNEPRWVAVRLFRGFSLIFVFIFVVGINHYGWHRYGINSVLIFEQNPRNHITFQHILEIASCLIVLWCVCVLGYFFSDRLGVPRLVFPLILFVCFYGWLFNPLKIGYYEARRWMMRKLYILATPLCHPVLFADFWLADQANSLVTFVSDMEYFGCFYIMEVDWTGGLVPRNRTPWSNETGWWTVDYATGHDQCNSLIYGIRPVIAVIPAAIRFFQCIRRYIDSKEKHPHLTNAGKYSTTFFVVLFGSLKSWYAGSHHIDSNSIYSPFFWLWAASYCISTCYTYSWDVRMDWGLWRNPKPGSTNWLLRNQLVYHHKTSYYIAIVADLFLRLAWTLNISISNFWYFHDGEMLVYVTALLECFRRFVWNFLRLENEHLNNCGEFRAVRDISVKVMPRRSRHFSVPRSRQGSVSEIVKAAVKGIKSGNKTVNGALQPRKSFDALSSLALAPLGLSVNELRTKKEANRSDSIPEATASPKSSGRFRPETSLRRLRKSSSAEVFYSAAPSSSGSSTDTSKNASSRQAGAYDNPAALP